MNYALAIIAALIIATAAWAEQNIPTPTPTPEIISPAPPVTISWDYLNYLLDTEVLAQDSVRSLQSCRRALKKERAKKARR